MKLSTVQEICQIASKDETLSILDFQSMLKLMAYAAPQEPKIKRGVGRPKKIQTENQIKMVTTVKADSEGRY